MNVESTFNGVTASQADRNKLSEVDQGVTTVDAMLNEVSFKGPSSAEIKLRKYGLTPSILNRHMESDSLRSRLAKLDM